VAKQTITAHGRICPLMARMISLIALSIDAMLPALPNIGHDPVSGGAGQNKLPPFFLILV